MEGGVGGINPSSAAGVSGIKVAFENVILNTVEGVKKFGNALPVLTETEIVAIAEQRQAGKEIVKLPTQKEIDKRLKQLKDPWVNCYQHNSEYLLDKLGENDAKPIDVPAAANDAPEKVKISHGRQKIDRYSQIIAFLTLTEII